nr:hypothetical protein [Tanacetum cinerariifolium]
LVENMEEVGSSNGELVKMGKASRNKGHNVNKLTPPPPIKIKEIPPLSSIALQPLYQPLSQKQKEKIKEVLDKKMKHDEIIMGRARLSNNDFSQEDRTRIIERGLPKKIQNHGEVRNVRIQIGYQAYLVGFLVLDIPVDKELPLLLGHLFLRACRVVIDIGCGTMIIDDGVIRHTYFPKPRAKEYLENFKIDEEDDWLSCFEVGRDEEDNPKYGPIAPSFFDIEDEMERALEMEAYFNPFKI